MTLIMNNQDVDVIADRTSPGRQGWTREVTVRTGPGGHKVRATVYRDSYDFQSRIKVEVWSPPELKWNTIRQLAGSDHKDLPSAYALSSGRDENAARRAISRGTRDLVEELIAYAQEVLS